MEKEPKIVAQSVETIGNVASRIRVELSTRFLEHFSEQLYSSPQKAFEELISNGWDAGADYVDVRISDDLDAEHATMTVLDNGVSMDEAGLRSLWHIAFSPKRATPVLHGRPVIGKFGIGKLATYVLASKLTYICKASDGVIRRVTMDYGTIDRQKGADPDKLISDLQLEIFEVTMADVERALSTVYGGSETLAAIKEGIKVEPGTEVVNEFGGQKADLKRPPSDTWTLVVLSGLKPTGKSLKVHVLKRMLEAALPFGSEMIIRVNGNRLGSSKGNVPVLKEWQVGPELNIDFVEVEDEEPTIVEEDAGAESGSVASGEEGVKEVGNPKEKKSKRVSVKAATTPYPHVEIEGIGKVTGVVKLFEEKISGGKSDERGPSNGFHVNVLGRVVNQSDPSFGEENLRESLNKSTDHAAAR